MFLQIITVNGAPISRPDNKVQFCDSIIHVVDKVIYPLPAGNVVETLVDVPAFSKIVELVKKAGLSDSLSSTFFFFLSTRRLSFILELSWF